MDDYPSSWQKLLHVRSTYHRCAQVLTDGLRAAAFKTEQPEVCLNLFLLESSTLILYGIIAYIDLENG
jgi:hypothetical protein